MGGEIEVLIESVDPSDPVIAALRDVVEQGRTAVLSVALDPDSARGAKALFVEGASVGSLGANPEQALLAAVSSCRERGDAGTVCLSIEGAPERVYLEAVLPAPTLVIVGATHTAVALCAMAAQVGYRVLVVDGRGAYARPELFPAADAVVVELPNEFLSRQALGRRDAVVTLTHDERFDVPALITALRSGAGYVGALGSRRTAERRFRRLRETGLEEAEIQRVRSPVGLDIGARTPEEIAVAIIAEIVSVHRGRSGSPLSGACSPEDGT